MKSYGIDKINDRARQYRRADEAILDAGHQDTGTDSWPGSSFSP